MAVLVYLLGSARSGNWEFNIRFEIGIKQMGSAVHT